MCEVTGWATPTGSNEPLYGRTDTKSPTVYSSMVLAAGGEGGSIRHDDDGRQLAAWFGLLLRHGDPEAFLWVDVMVGVLDLLYGNGGAGSFLTRFARV